ncbi:unnamed protein product [Rotaria magnacalcarata]|uniref:G-protein coupled receptors family 1 profile domain-containing protein n=4 Tax=Rotaria magnacalcarata TaxID=392030 RepID=A0A816L0Z9_9BILA|nr:unnamed protein product [Rotaria magnacalcarata]CAF1227629.1 unnamed protein product [Rotaria magnacalcarata]CAF1902436.1 unnamed protein product [Rotaria magnacalcarata]CAF1929359.1 unnamed protein product [Rotaria magnacalcarata]CAF1962471.1 unnamed protein product [Rotaria magnacalcarata]
MNQTWISLSNIDRLTKRYDYNNFLLTADLFLNDTNNDVNLIYQSFFFSSTITPHAFQTISNINQSIIIKDPEANALSSSIEKFILTFLMSTMAFLTVSGNSLVIIAFICEPTIRTYSNYFILNLSIADLLIGLICIPLYAHKIIFGEWYLGYFLCKLWLVFDYVVGSASTLCIVVISYDRYQMVSKGLNYISKTKIRRALKFVLGTWIIAMLNYGPAILLWDLLPGNNEPFQDRSCDPPFANNFPYLVTTAFVEFFVPFFSLTTLNLLVYLNIRQRSHGLIRTKNDNSAHVKSSITSHTDRSILNYSENGYHQKTKNYDEQELKKLNSTNNNPLPVTTTYAKSSSSLALVRDRKAAKNLFILVFAFVICWCPYTLLTLVRALRKQPDKYISEFIYEVTFWLLWLNSTINPFLYSFLHVKFRKAFYRILCFYNLNHGRRLTEHRI